MRVDDSAGDDCSVRDPGGRRPPAAGAAPSEAPTGATPDRSMGSTAPRAVEIVRGTAGTSTGTGSTAGAGWGRSVGAGLAGGSIDALGAAGATGASGTAAGGGSPGHPRAAAGGPRQPRGRPWGPSGTGAAHAPGS